MPGVKVNIPQVGAVNFPDGMSQDDIQSAVASIYSQALTANPPGAARPNVNMQPSGWAPSYQDTAQRGAPPSNVDTTRIAPNAAGVAGMPGASPNLVSASPGYTAAVGIPAGVAATAMGGSAALPFLTAAAAKYPRTAAIAESLAIQEAVHGARQIPYVGRYVPPAADILGYLPFLGGGRKLSPSAQAEGGAQTWRDATRSNVPYAGEEIPEPAPQGAQTWRDATRSNVPYAGEAPALPFLRGSGGAAPETQAAPSAPMTPGVRSRANGPTRPIAPEARPSRPVTVQGVPTDPNDLLDALERSLAAAQGQR